MGNIGDHVAGDVGVVRICGDVNDRSRAGNFNYRARRADCQRQINRGKVAYFNNDALALQLIKSGGLYYDGVDSGGQVREAIVTAAIGFQVLRTHERGTCQHYLCLGNQCSARVSDGSLQAASCFLSQHRTDEGKNQNNGHRPQLK